MAITVAYDHGEGIYTLQSLKNRNFGLVTGKIDCDNDYPAGGYDADDISGLFRECLGMVFLPWGYYQLSYLFQTDKIAVGHNTPTLASSSFADGQQGYTVTYDATPGGNAIYVKFGAHGAYLCCNMATDTVDKHLTFGDGIYVTIKHDADAASGNGSAALTFDDDGTQPDRLIADLSGGVDADVYIPTTDPRYFLKIKNAASGGAAITFDDGTDERIECVCAGEEDADINLAVQVDPELLLANELPAGTDASALTDIPFFAWGWM